MIPLSDEKAARRVPALTILLVAANVAAFAWEIDLFALPGAHASGQLQRYVESRLSDGAFRGGLIPYELLTFTDIERRALVPPPLTALTSLFLHGGFLHLAVNMLFLWIFGRGVERALGRPRFAGVYLACGVLGALVQVVASAMTGGMLVPIVGASGAIAGLLPAYVVLFPRARLLRVRAGWLIGGWFLIQLLSVSFGGNTGVALFAHIGGFVAGWLLVRILGGRPTWRARRALG